MIDDKKIDEAAYRFATSQTHGELLALIDGYKEGFKDAINAFLKDLWHPFLQEINVNAIKSIPLTPAILEKNGWKRNGGQYSFTYKSYAGDKVELIGFFIEMFKDVHDMLKHRYFQITHEDKVICGCFYVHQLQHLLFGLGINHEMEE